MSTIAKKRRSKKDHVEGILIIDRSASMNTIRDTAISGINEFIAAQKSLDIPCYITIVQFDNEYEVLVDHQLAAEVSEFTTETYLPRGMTALNDAIGKTITTVQARHKDLKKSERPSRVIVSVITDGHENASQEYTGPMIKDLIEGLKGSTWEVLYIASNQDAIAVAQTMGISSSNALSFTSTGPQGSQGSQGAFRAMNSYVNDYLSTGTAAFTDEDRKKAKVD